MTFVSNVRGGIQKLLSMEWIPTTSKLSLYRTNREMLAAMGGVRKGSEKQLFDANISK